MVYSEENQQADNDNKKKPCATFFEGTLILFGRADHFIERHDKSIVAVFTVVLALSTIGLWLATARLWRTTSDTLSHAESTARHQLRAYLTVIVGGALYQERDKGLRFEARPSIVNTGQTTAHDVAYWANAAILTILIPANFNFPPPPNVQWVGGAVLGPRHDFIANAVVPDFVPDEEINAIKDGDGRALCVWGRVAYRDVFGGIHFTEFSQILTWLPNGQIFGRYERHNRAS
jgi:hypothetical protein